MNCDYSWDLADSKHGSKYKNHAESMTTVPTYMQTYTLFAVCGCGSKKVCSCTSRHVSLLDRKLNLLTRWQWSGNARQEQELAGPCTGTN